MKQQSGSTAVEDWSFQSDLGVYLSEISLHLWLQQEESFWCTKEVTCFWKLLLFVGFCNQLVLLYSPCCELFDDHGYFWIFSTMHLSVCSKQCTCSISGYFQECIYLVAQSNWSNAIPEGNRREGEESDREPTLSSAKDCTAESLSFQIQTKNHTYQH